MDLNDKIQLQKIFNTVLKRNTDIIQNLESTIGYLATSKTVRDFNEKYNLKHGEPKTLLEKEEHIYTQNRFLGIYFKLNNRRLIDF